MAAKLTKADLQCFCLYLYKTSVQADGCLAYWMLSRKSDKSQSFNTNN